MEKTVCAKSAACITILGLSACGGGGTAPTVDPVFLEERQQFLNQTAAIGLADTFPSIATPATDIPTSGSASYTGPIALIARDSGTASDITISATTLTDEGMLGEMNLTANFGPTGGTLSGTAQNFRTADGTIVVGQLDMATSSIDRIFFPGGSSVTFTSAISGTLTGTPIGTADLDGSVLGGFADPNAVMWGRATGNSSISNDAFSAIFVAPEN